MFDYPALYNEMRVNPVSQQAAMVIAKQIKADPRYRQVSQITGVSVNLLGVLHQMESNRDFTTHLHNGDSLKGRTVQVPSGRPLKGNPPFTWVQSAVDAVQYDNVTKSKDPAQQCKAAVLFNGLGYEKYKVNSPYGFNGTNLYTKGKFVADGKYNPNVISSQLGACVILQALDALDSQITNPDTVPIKGGVAQSPVVTKLLFNTVKATDKLSDYFVAGEFTKNGTRKFHSQKGLEACIELSQHLDTIRDKYRVPIKISSGIRSRLYNMKIGGAPLSQHIIENETCAADIIVQGVPNRKVYADLDKTHPGGLGLYSSANGTTHVDLRREEFVDPLTGLPSRRIKKVRWDWTNR